MSSAPAKATALAALLLMLGAGAAAPTAAASLGDPTAPSPRGQAGAGTGTDGELTWTRVTENRREAVINGVRVTEGDRLGGARILRIRHGEVVIEQANGRSTLRLQPSRIKRSP